MAATRSAPVAGWDELKRPPTAVIAPAATARAAAPYVGLPLRRSANGGVTAFQWERSVPR